MLTFCPASRGEYGEGERKRQCKCSKNGFREKIDKDMRGETLVFSFNLAEMYRYFVDFMFVHFVYSIRLRT